MTFVLKINGASSASQQWHAIDWQVIEKDVFRLQVRIAKAVKDNRWGKVKALQRLLTRSHNARLLAVKRVTSNKGSKTPGIDGVVWNTATAKWNGVQSLSCRGYKAQPLRRIYIPKKNGKKRPLGIPTIRDRAMQALFLLAFEPVTETTADIHSYGFRPKRCAADAIERCFVVLSRKVSARWILEGDIRGCFDHICHDWMLENVCLERKILRQWLKAGFMEKNRLFASHAGTPQGGIISPCMANAVLDGIEQVIKSITRPSDKVHMIRYADDFIITGNCPVLLRDRIKPVIEAFLQERGLQLSEEKTLLTSIEQGFDFLDFNVRKYQEKLLIKPSKSSVKSLRDAIKETINDGMSMPTLQLIQQLNMKIRGWTNYFRHVVAKSIFGAIDAFTFRKLYRWIKRRHPNKSAHWLYHKYYCCRGMRKWIFHANYRLNNGDVKSVHLFNASDMPIRRHRQIVSEANPYDVSYLRYFQNRVNKVLALRTTAGQPKLTF